MLTSGVHFKKRKEVSKMFELLLISIGSAVLGLSLLIFPVAPGDNAAAIATGTLLLIGAVAGVGILCEKKSGDVLQDPKRRPLLAAPVFIFIRTYAVGLKPDIVFA
jgi:hypothetical protein